MHSQPLVDEHHAEGATAKSTIATATSSDASRRTTNVAPAAMPMTQTTSAKVATLTAAAAAAAVSPRLPIRLDALRHSKATEPRIMPPPPPINCELLAKGDTAAHIAAARAIARDGFCVCRADLQPQVVGNARAEAHALYSTDGGAFTPGGFTAGGKTIAGTEKTSRGDHVMWLHTRLKRFGGDFKKAAVPTVTALDQLLTTFATKTFAHFQQIGAVDPESLACFDDGAPLHCCGRSDMMVTCYPGKRAAYGKHIDSVDGDGREKKDRGRVWTLVFYLNDPPWDAATDGGTLRIFPPPAPPAIPAGGDEAAEAEAAAARPNVAHDILPTANTFVIFRADRVVHEVRPAHKARMAASIWFYGGKQEEARAAVERGESMVAS